MYKGKIAKQGVVPYATTGEALWVESRLEAKVLHELDRDPRIGAVSSQPFRIFFDVPKGTPKGGPRDHVPDFFARRTDGVGVVVDVKPRALMTPKVVTQFEWTAALCAEVGWRHVVVHDSSRVRDANMRWLAGYRSQPVHVDVVAPIVFDLAADGGVPWGDLVDEASAQSGVHRAFVIPAIGHLVWKFDLQVDLDRPLSSSTIVELVGDRHVA